MTKLEKSKMSAPPAYGIAKHTKERYTNLKNFINFVTNYIQKPDKRKSICRKEAIARFGLMPPIGLQLTNEERIKVATFLWKLN